MKNEIYLRRRNKIIINTASNKDLLSDVYISSMLKNIESLGFTFSKELIAEIKKLSVEETKELYIDLILNLKKMVGANVRYNPMYPNFPEQVMDMDECELYLNAIIHYLSYGCLLPDYEHKERFPLLNEGKIKIIDLGNEDDFLSVFTNLLNAKTSLSKTDKTDMEWFISEYKQDIIAYLPTEIYLKENVALITSLLLKYKVCSEQSLYKYFKTATDVLRLAVALSNGDISLATNTRFKSFTRAERRLLLGFLENCKNIEEDMSRYKGQWIRLGERLHPSEYKTQYNKAQIAFNKLRNNEKINTYNGIIAECIDLKQCDKALELLKQRPSEFARKLDYLLRTFPNTNLVLNEFKHISENVSTTILLQTMEHFKYRNANKDIRVFFPKGNIAKAHVIENTLDIIDSNICNSVITICENALLNIFKTKDFLGKVYLDENIKGYLIPFSQRSASKSFKTVVRGSKINLPEDIKTIRSFIYWKDSDLGRTDIDLSAVMYDKDWNYIEHISYTNLKSAKYQSCHSGDITSAPNGASEFIDLDIESVKRYGGRYIVMSVNSFTGQSFTEVKECFMGWMNRQEPNSGEIYEPTTVQNKIDITADTRICVPIIIDTFENKVIWADLALKRCPNYSINIENNQKGMILMGKAISELVKPNLYNLFDLHIKARGIKCDNKEDADIIFSLEDGITPFDTDKIVSEFL